MPRRLFALAFALLLACAGSAAAQSEDPYGAIPTGPQAVLKGGAAEFYIHPLPERWSWQLVDSAPPFHAITFLPEGQARTGWTEGVVMSVFVGRPVPPQGLLVEAERRLATRCRDLRRSATEAVTSEAGWAEAWQLLACAQTLDAGGRPQGGGEVHLLRAIQGQDAGYLVRRVWRTPSIGAEFPVGQGEVEATRALLGEGRVCRSDLGGAKGCPSYAAMGIGSIEDQRPFGVFELRR